MSGCPGNRESPRGEIACVRGLFFVPRLLSLATGEPYREQFDPTDSRSEEVLSLPERDRCPGLGPFMPVGGEDDRLETPAVTALPDPTVGRVKHCSGP